MKKIMDYVTGFLGGKDKKKLIENFVIIIIIGVIAIIAGGSFFGAKKEDKRETGVAAGDAVAASGSSGALEEKNEIARQVEGILGQMEGSGKVKVMITYFTGKEIVPAYDTRTSDNSTNEKDTGGGTRSIKQNDCESKVAYEDIQGGVKKPIILKEVLPQVKGVVVVAEGAGDIQVRERLTMAVQVLLDVPIHRIQVFEKGG